MMAATSITGITPLSRGIECPTDCRQVAMESHIGVHDIEMADKLANEATEECTKARHRDVSQEYCEAFNGQVLDTTQDPGAHNDKNLESLWDLHNNLSQKVHTKHKLGSSNQDSVYFQLWKNLQLTEIKAIVTTSAL